jgi:hypothetical protein
MTKNFQEFVSFPASCAGVVDACGVGICGVAFPEPGAEGRFLP